MTHRQTLQGFPIRVKRRSKKKIKPTYLYCSGACREPGSDTFNFINERTELMAHTSAHTTANTQL
jgi:hypothetical protein